MSRRFLACVVVAVLALCTGCTSGPSSPRQLEAGLAQQLDTAITDTLRTTEIPGAIVGIWTPKGEYVRAVGVADKSTGTPMRIDMFHRIGSVTKTFTVTAVLQLVDAGKLGLDDPIARYVDGVPNGDVITIRQLAEMRSGLFNYSMSDAFVRDFAANPRRVFTPQELLGYAFAQPPVFAPGQRFQYCNTNTIVLGLAVERITGQRLPDYLHDHIIAPLGLAHTTFPSTNAIPDPHAQGYTTQTPGGVEAVATDWSPSWSWAAAQMISTLEDMHTWVPALVNGTLLKPETQQQRLKTFGMPPLPPEDGYGLGIFNVDGWIGHSGSVPGYQTVAAYSPKAQITLVLMINTDIPHGNAWPATALATAITKVIAPQQVFVMENGLTQPPMAPR